MKRFKNPGRYPFIILLVVSTLILTVMGYMGRNTVYADYTLNLLKNPRLSVVLEGIKDKNYPWRTAKENNAVDDATKDADSTVADNASEDADGTVADNASEDADGTVADNTSENSDNTADNASKGSDNTESDNTSKDADSTTTGDTSKNTDNTATGDTSKDADNAATDNTNTNKGAGTKDTDSKGTTDNNTSDNTEKGSKPAPDDSKGSGDSNSDDNATYGFATVKEKYFDDALFIGDSRTVGLYEYSGWKKPTYYANVGLTIYDVFDKKVAEVNGEKITIEKALQKKSFKKIYIMLGINEMGTGTAKTFTKKYKEVVDRIEELQPDAIIIIEGIMNVTKKKSDTDPIFNNKNIKERNDHIALLADNKKIFYIDVNEAITDSTGGIPGKYTFDNIHLKAAYYKIWTDFLLKHGVVKK